MIEKKYPACVDRELVQALDLAKRWVADTEFCISIGVYPTPSPAGVITALSRLEADRSPDAQMSGAPAHI